MTMQSTVSESKYIRNKVTGQIVLNGFELVGFENYTPNYVPRVFKSSFKRANKITLEKQLEKPSMPKGNIWKKQNATTKKEWRNSRSLFGSLGISRKDTNTLNNADISFNKYLHLRHNNTHQQIIENCK